MTATVADSLRRIKIPLSRKLDGMTTEPRPRTQINDATGRQVAANVRRIREVRGWSTYDLSRVLAKAGRPIAPSAIAKVERAERRVDVGDLVALAAVLGVSPASLLLPNDDLPTKSVEITGAGTVPADTAWEWASNKRPLRLPEETRKRLMLEYKLYALPPGMAGLVGEAQPLRGWVTRDGVQYDSETGEPRGGSDGPSVD
ncbi:helix-turn-helix domain-containing protein [Streptomyces xanthophaeus]